MTEISVCFSHFRYFCIFRLSVVFNFKSNYNVNHSQLCILCIAYYVQHKVDCPLLIPAFQCPHNGHSVEKNFTTSFLTPPSGGGIHLQLIIPKYIWYPIQFNDKYIYAVCQMQPVWQILPLSLDIQEPKKSFSFSSFTPL